MILHKDDIVRDLEKAGAEFSTFCQSISDKDFFRQPQTKWSIAQNVAHLVTSANMTRLVYRLPKFVVKMYSGKPNRPSRTYEELVERYLTKLGNGGKASGQFDTKPVDAKQGKEKLLGTFDQSMSKLIGQIQHNWQDTQLDQFLAPHPLLGKITLRELGYFTIYHTGHHLAIVKDRVNDVF